MNYKLRRRQVIRRPLSDVFPFFQNPENLARITPSQLNFVILSPTPIEMKAGARIDYTIRLLGIPVHWTTEITEYEPPYFFADEQRRGPYRLWHHEHRFREVPEGTEMLDEVTYDVGWGWIGMLVVKLWVRRQLDTIFDFRAKVIDDLFQRKP